MDEEEDNNVRAPDQVVTGSLYDDSETPDTLQDRINQLLSHGLSPDEAEAIARSQMETAREEHRNMNLENTVAILKQQMEAKERERQYKNKMASEASSSAEETKLEAFNKMLTDNFKARRFTDNTRNLIEKALQNKKENGFRSQLEIPDEAYNKIVAEISTIVKNPRANMTEKDVAAIVDLFTPPIHGDSDYEYNSGNESDYDGYDTSGGRRTRKARKSRKSRKSKKSKKTKKSRKTRKNKRK